MGLGRGSRGAPLSRVCLSSVIVNVLRALDYGVHISDPITGALIHSVGAMSVNDSDLYCWIESMESAEEMYEQIQKETTAWGHLLVVTGGYLKPEKRCWYMLDYECNDGVWTPRELVDWKLMIPVDDGTAQPILSLSPEENKKALGVKDCPAGGSTDQLKAIKDKMEQWILGMKMDIFLLVELG